MLILTSTVIFLPARSPVKLKSGFPPKSSENIMISYTNFDPFVLSSGLSYFFNFSLPPFLLYSFYHNPKSFATVKLKFIHGWVGNFWGVGVGGASQVYYYCI